MHASSWTRSTPCAATSAACTWRLSLERLARLADAAVQRIGLSATQRPLDEVARFLGGQDVGRGRRRGGEQLPSRRVTIVDAGAHKDLDLQVVTVVPDLRQLPAARSGPR